MATSDKHCQTLCVKNAKNAKINSDPANYAQVMYDETIPVVNATEIESPEDSDNETVVKSAMSKFTPPVRHTARHDFDSESETDSEPEKFLNNVSVSEEDVSPDRKSLQRLPESVARDLPRKGSKDGAAKTLSRQKSKQQIDSSDNSDTDSGDTEAPATAPPLPSSRKRGAVIPAEGAYDPKQYQALSVPPEMEAIFQNIMNYTPQKIDIDLKLQPFTPEYVPAVGDIDAFIKVTTPAANVRAEPTAERAHEHIDNLGLTVLDEPAAGQSDSALLHLQLRALSKTCSAKATVLTKKIEDAEKNTKAIDRWIKDVSELHLSKPAPNVSYTDKMPDIDALMAEWPAGMEAALNSEGFPPASLDCTLAEYAALTCAMFDVPVAKDGGGDTSLAAHVQSLHVLFTLYAAVRGSQLYAERERDGVSDPV